MKYTYVLTVRDEDGFHTDPDMLTDEGLILLSDKIANGSWVGKFKDEENENAS